MTCDRREVIHVINVTYGRTDDSTCSRGDTTKRCRAKVAPEILRERCWGERRTCKVKASNSLFGDPCVGTFLYFWFFFILFYLYVPSFFLSCKKKLGSKRKQTEDIIYNYVLLKHFSHLVIFDFDGILFHLTYCKIFLETTP